jgi:hypothetical protein
MIKNLITVAAAAAIALTASANVDILDSFGSAGWGSSYDKDSKTITYDGEYKGRGWWLDGADYSEYSSIVIEFEPLKSYAQIVVEYVSGTDDEGNAVNYDNSSAGASKDATKIECVFDNDHKNSIKQIYLQSSTANTIVLTAAYLVEAGDPTAEKVLFEGEQALSWYPGYELDKGKVTAVAAGSKLKIETSYEGDGWSVKLGIDQTNDVLPSFKELNGYQEKYMSIWTSQNPWTYTITDADIAALKASTDSKLRICSDDTVILTKLTLIPAVVEDGGDQTSVSSIAVDSNAPVEYFNLQGVRVANPQNGLFIRRQGNVATKVLVK